MPHTLASGDTKQEALDKFKNVFDKLNTEKEGIPLTKFDIYAYLGQHAAD